MTGDAGPAELPGQSRIPFSCYLEEHVRYSKPQSCASGDEWDDACHIPLFPPTSWTRKEVSSPIWAKGETAMLTGPSFDRTEWNCSTDVLLQRYSTKP
jgi:hypothetical protein